MAAPTISERTRAVADPVRNFKFHVQFMHPNRNLDVALGLLGFTSVDGLSMSTDVTAYREGGWNAQPLSAKVLTKEGWKSMADLQVGDRVISPFGEESKVEGIFPKGEREVYRITLRDGSSTLACDQHLWNVTATSHYKDQTINTLEMLDLIEEGHPVWLPEIDPVEFDSMDELPLDPYLLGVLLSEGNIAEKRVSFTQGPDGQEMIDRVASVLPEGVYLNPFGVNSYMLTTGPATTSPNTDSHYNRNPVMAALRELGLGGLHSYDKFIPEAYLRASVEDRLALLQGIMDGDGYITDTGRIGFSSSSEQLTNDVKDLINSLGGRCTVLRITDKHYTSPTQEEPKAARDEFSISSAQMYLNPFYLSRKADRFIPKNAAYHRAVVSVELEGVEEVQCILVSAESHLYITDDYIPTHNTNPHKLPGQTDFAPLSCSTGVFYTKDGMWEAAKQMFSVQWGQGTIPLNGEFRFDMIIRVMDHPVTLGPASGAGNNKVAGAVMAFKAYNAWVANVQFGGLNAGDNGILVSSMTVHHEGLEVLYGPDKAIPG